MIARKESLMYLSTYTGVILRLNAAIDIGRHQGITIDEARQHIEDGEIFAFLIQRLGDDIDFR